MFIYVKDQYYIVFNNYIELIGIRVQFKKENVKFKLLNRTSNQDLGLEFLLIKYENLEVKIWVVLELKLRVQEI